MLAKMRIIAFALCLLAGPAHAQQTSNHLPRGTAAFDKRFDIDAHGYNATNSYLAIYLANVVYPEFLDQLTGSPLKQDTSSTTEWHKNPKTFYAEFVKRIEYLFKNAEFTWVYGVHDKYDPEAMIISTSKAVFVVFRGTDRTGSALTGVAGGAYQWDEWLKTDFKINQISPDLSSLGTGPTESGETKIHAGFWESMAVSKPFTVAQKATGIEEKSCEYASLGHPSFRECLVGVIRAAGGGSKTVFIIGHSLGAAQAQLFSAYLAAHQTNDGHHDGIKVQTVYLVASPHPGNREFVRRLHQLIGKDQIQRFDFVNDPVTMLPPYQTGLDTYARSGTRIYYDDVQTVQVGVPERVPGIGEPVWTDMTAGVMIGGIMGPAGALVGGAAFALSDFCYHYPQWHLNAAWSAVHRQIREDLPSPLPIPQNAGLAPRVYDNCENPLTVARGNRSESGRVADAAADALGDIEEAAEELIYTAKGVFSNLLEHPVSDGYYIFQLLGGQKWLDIKSCQGDNGCAVNLSVLGANHSDNRFYVKKEIGAYSLRNGNANKADFLEVAAGDIMDNYGRVQMWEANLPFGGHSPNQLWHFYPIPNHSDHFLIRNVASGKVLSGKAACATQNGCTVFQRNAVNNSLYSVWILKKDN
jgi:pimeloyl-ACP methyl ester carboxylesterase